MKIIKKYTAIQLYTEKMNDSIKVKLEFGNITGPYYSQTSPKEEFDTEEEAIKYAYETNKYRRWLILPLIQFDNFD